MENKHKMFIWLSCLTILSSFSLIFYVMFMTFFPFRTVDYLNQPLEILNQNKEVRVGEYVMIKVKYCRYTEKVTHIATTLKNEIYFTLPSFDIKAPKGCGETISKILIPEGVPEGKFSVLLTASWDFTSLRTITKEVETEKFTVVE